MKYRWIILLTALFALSNISVQAQTKPNKERRNAKLEQRKRDSTASDVGEKVKVTFNSAPMDADLYVDTEYRGHTPQEISLTEGKHIIRMEKDGVSWEDTIEVSPNGPRVFTADLQYDLSYMREVTFKSTPDSAIVYVDNALRGYTTPSKIKLKVGKHQIRVVRDDVTLNTKINVNESGSNVWNFDVRPDGLVRDSVTDYDGNVYRIVKLGNQYWMAENLRTTHYADGTFIRMLPSIINIPCRYYPNNDSTTVADYGYLYNWRAVMNKSASSSRNPSGVQGICPKGWHVPSDAEWQQLVDYMGTQAKYWCTNDTLSFAKALTSKEGWESDEGDCAIGNEQEENNASGFNARPAGYFSSEYGSFGRNADFWSATEQDVSNAKYRFLSKRRSTIGSNSCEKYNAFPVRCLRDKK